ncbi:MAG: hypothetical protein A3K19_20345 [Lentisphaerae bacterium RIFOXYB12_FULL_65_16]|nr:MAG: hypothetical protein A3K18_11360 [Lentisphaerae bacterium RIFOXYA12_64_32]OGV89362.1 MAG: hypothetical protein A3K19_20345 [Lentisphaerae bacterium RIFOXYB12_FULL_65_16]
MSCTADTAVPWTDRAYREFHGAGCGATDADLRLDVVLTAEAVPATANGATAVGCSESWTVSRTGAERWIVLQPPGHGDPLWSARFDGTPDRVTVYCGKGFVQDRNGQVEVFSPVHYPLDQLLLMYALAERCGLVLHAAGARVAGKGVVFAGKSGAGKSTLMRQVCQRPSPGMAPLSDDRVVIRAQDRGLQVFGSPWPGDAGIAANLGCCLSAILFLKHGTENSLRSLEPREVLAGLLPVASLLWFEPELLTCMLSFCDRLVREIPAFEFSFRPDLESVDVLESFAKQL